MKRNKYDVIDSLVSKSKSMSYSVLTFFLMQRDNAPKTGKDYLMKKF